MNPVNKIVLGNPIKSQLEINDGHYYGKYRILENSYKHHLDIHFYIPLNTQLFEQLYKQLYVEL